MTTSSPIGFFFIFLFLTFAWLSPVHAGISRCEDEQIERTPIATRLDEGMLFTVATPDCKISYLFGTMHLDDRDVLASAATAIEELQRSRHALFELVDNDDAKTAALRAMTFPPGEGRTLSTLIGADQFNRLLAEISQNHKGFPAPALERYRPWAASILFQIPANTHDGIALDDRLQSIARQHLIPVRGMETVEQQMSVFTGMDEPTQIAMLKDALDHAGEIHAMNEELKRLYLKGDLDGIATLGEQAFSEVSDPEVRRKMRRELIDRRNQSLTEDMLPYLTQGDSFVAVGALHLPGAGGILALLEQKGFILWPAPTP